MRRIIFFIPFPIRCFGEQFEKCLKWSRYISEHKPDHEVSITWHTGKSWPEIEHSTFANAAIYIRGHGSPGGIEIVSDEEASDACRYDELGIRLVQAGLNKMSMAEIKFWNCNGGSDAGPNVSFAKRCANWLRDQGYTRCKYCAYTECLSSYYDEGSGTSWPCTRGRLSSAGCSASGRSRVKRANTGSGCSPRVRGPVRAGRRAHGSSPRPAWGRKSRRRRPRLVAGAGFEPATFGL